MTRAERAQLKRCGYEVKPASAWGRLPPGLAAEGIEVGNEPYVRPPYGNRFVDPRAEIDFVRRVGEEAATALASLAAVAGADHARGVRALWDLDPAAAGTFLRDGAHLEELLAEARRGDVRRHVSENCR